MGRTSEAGVQCLCHLDLGPQAGLGRKLVPRVLDAVFEVVTPTLSIVRSKACGAVLGLIRLQVFRPWVLLVEGKMLTMSQTVLPL